VCRTATCRNRAVNAVKAYLEPEEIHRMEEAAANPRDRLLVRLLFRTGMRISEALALEVKDLDLTGGTVTILHLKAHVKLACPQCGVRLGRTHAFCPGCGAKVEGAVARRQETRRRRTVPLDDDTAAMLGDYVRQGGPVLRSGRRMLFGITRGRAWQVVKECADRAGLGRLVNTETGRVHHVSPHRLRDAFAVMAVQHDDSTDSIRMLQEQLGHANIGTTMRYRKVAGQELREWYQSLWRKHSSV